MKVLIDYEIRDTAKTLGNVKWYRRTGESEWWTAGEEARRVKRRVHCVVASINAKRPTNAPASAYWVVGSPLPEDWYTVNFLHRATGKTNAFLQSLRDPETGILRYREPSPMHSAFGRMRAVKQKQREESRASAAIRDWVAKSFAAASR